MLRSRSYVVMATLGLLLLAGMWAGSGALHAQTTPSVPKPTFQYVGVEQTIARVDLATGKIQILEQPDSTRASLLVKHSRPWEWREIPVLEHRPAPGESAEPRSDPGSEKPE
ncbi:MAG: hypothetical protein V2A79_16765 [Planctomycetota bacterium]